MHAYFTHRELARNETQCSTPLCQRHDALVPEPLPCECIQLSLQAYQRILLVLGIKQATTLFKDCQRILKGSCICICVYECEWCDSVTEFGGILATNFATRAQPAGGRDMMAAIHPADYLPVYMRV